MQSVKVSVTTTGSAGSATGTAFSANSVFGAILAIRVDYHASAPATTDIDVVVESDENRPEVTLYDKDNANTDVWVYPKVQSTDITGTAIDSQYQWVFSAGGRVKVTVGGCDALTDAVVVYVFALD